MVCCGSISTDRRRKRSKSYSSDKVQLALDGKAEVVQIQIVEVVVERIFTN